MFCKKLDVQMNEHDAVDKRHGSSTITNKTSICSSGIINNVM